MEVQTYVGNGTYGIENACSVTFSEEPIFILMFTTGSYDFGTYSNSYRYVLILSSLEYIGSYAFYLGFLPKDDTYYAGTSWTGTTQTVISIKKSLDGKTITWYGSSANYQSNVIDSNNAVIAFYLK